MYHEPRNKVPILEWHKLEQLTKSAKICLLYSRVMSSDQSLDKASFSARVDARSNIILKCPRVWSHDLRAYLIDDSKPSKF